MREVIRHHVSIGVDQIKLSMSGEEVSLASAIVSQLLTAVPDPRDSISPRLLFHRGGNSSMRGRRFVYCKLVLLSSNRLTISQHTVTELSPSK